MKLEAVPPKGGETFHLKVTGTQSVNRGLLTLGIFLGVVGICLFMLGPPPVADDATRQQIVALYQVLSIALTLAFSVVVGVAMHSAQDFDLHIFGETDGSLKVDGLLGDEPRRDYLPDDGPYSLAIIRRVTSDVPMGSVDVVQQESFAKAQDEASSGSDVAYFLRTEVALIDGDANHHSLLLVSEVFPGEAEAVLNELRATAQGHVEHLRGGGYVLRLPRHARAK